MKTIKLKIINKVNFDEEIRIFNSIVRIAFNRFQDKMDQKQVRAYCSNIFSNKNSWFIQCAIKEGKALYNRFKNRKIIFGGKNNYKKYMKGLIDKQAWKQKRLIPISIQGQKLQRGNRLFDFDLINHKIFYKPCKGTKIQIKVNQFIGKIEKELNLVQKLIGDKKITISIKFNNEYVWISYDEKLISQQIYQGLKQKRIFGIDLNPNAIGISIIEFNMKNKFKILHKQVFNIYQLNDKKVNNNKRKYELIDICHKIDKLMNIWKCAKIVIEELNIKSKNNKKGKEFNRLCNNVWCRNLIINKLKMLSNMHNYELIQVNPMYSSFIGNMLYGNENTPDMIASSIEIGRRGYKKYNKNWFYPRFDVDKLDEQWKQTLFGINSWVKSFDKIKKSKLKYRFLLSDYIKNAVFSKIYKKNFIQILIF